jgi:hypothetical protein
LILAAYLAADPKIQLADEQNIVMEQVLKHGLDVGGQTVTLPAPRLVDGQGADEERAVLKRVAGSDRALADLLRDSVTAPFVMKLRDSKVDGATVRQADLWFTVRGDLDKIDPAHFAVKTDQKQVDVANMLFETRVLKPDEIRAGGITPRESGSHRNEWYVHIRSKLLDRIEFEVTNHIVASQSPESIVIASATDPAFAKGSLFGNGWRAVSKTEGSPSRNAERQPYTGGISYAKISKLAFQPGMLFVEMHMAFVEPDDWFQGAPILRSKFSVAAQDQIRTLRRELARKRTD